MMREKNMENSAAGSILLTGGAGFIGSNFVLEWLKAGRGTLVNLDKLTYAGNPASLAEVEHHPDYHFVQGDICDRALLDSLLQQFKPTAILHFAAESHVDRSILGPEAFVETNVRGTLQLLQAAHSYYSAVDSALRQRFRFLHVSTDEVYGTLAPEDPAFHERTPYAPNSPYAASKAASDHLVRAWVHTFGLPAIITNCSNNYGPFQFPEKLIPLMSANALAGKPLPVYGDGGQIRDWLYVGDHVTALQTVLESGLPGETYNVGGGNQRTNMQVVTAICDLLDELAPHSPFRPHRSLITHVQDRPGHDRRYAIDSTKLQGELGWRPAHQFEIGLRATVAWYLANQGWVENVTSGAYRQWMARNYGDRGQHAASAHGGAQ